MQASFLRVPSSVGMDGILSRNQRFSITLPEAVPRHASVDRSPSLPCRGGSCARPDGASSRLRPRFSCVAGGCRGEAPAERNPRSPAQARQAPPSPSPCHTQGLMTEGTATIACARNVMAAVVGGAGGLPASRTSAAGRPENFAVPPRQTPQRQRPEPSWLRSC